MPSGTNVIHTAAVKLQVNGIGNLDLQLRGLNNVIEEDVDQVEMTASSARERQRLTNFVGEYVKLRGSTDEIGEFFDISSITFFISPIWSGYPGDD